VLRPAALAATASVLITGASAAAPPLAQLAYIGKYQGTPALYLANADGSERMLLARGVSDHTTFSWSPDGQRLAFTRGGGRSQEIWLVDAHGTGLTQLTHSAGTRKRTQYDWSENPSWSPAGEWIAFDGERRNQLGRYPQVFVIRPDGSGERQVTRAQTTEWIPAWVPGGRIVVEHPVGSRQIDLYSVRANGTGRLLLGRVHNEADHCACVAWSPDGTKLAYEAAGTAGKPDIWTMHADGTGRTQLTTHPSRDENPDWSPDGTQIAFYTERTGNGQIYVMNADGTKQRRVTRDPWYDQAVRWRPAP